MSALDELITNRSNAELQAAQSIRHIKYADMTAEQKQVYNSGLGAYRYTDVNRVGAACAEIYAIVTGYGYTVPNYTALRQNWTDSERFMPSDAQQYLATINAIKQAFNASQSIPASMQHISYEDANNIEKLLQEVDALFKRISSVFIRSGVYYGGATMYIKEAAT